MVLFGDCYFFLEEGGGVKPELRRGLHRLGGRVWGGGRLGPSAGAVPAGRPPPHDRQHPPRVQVLDGPSGGSCGRCCRFQARAMEGNYCGRPVSRFFLGPKKSRVPRLHISHTTLAIQELMHPSEPIRFLKYKRNAILKTRKLQNSAFKESKRCSKNTIHFSYFFEYILRKTG